MIGQRLLLGVLTLFIISGGYNIYPKEIELVLDAQPGVLRTAFTPGSKLSTL